MNTPPLLQFFKKKCVVLKQMCLENNVYLGNSCDESIPILEISIEITLINYTARLGLD